MVVNDVIACDSVLIKENTGSIKLMGCVAPKVIAETRTGNIEGRLISDKIFIVRSKTGRVEAPKTVSGGMCEATTITGNIKFFSPEYANI